MPQAYGALDPSRRNCGKLGDETRRNSGTCLTKSGGWQALYDAEKILGAGPFGL